MVKRCGQCGERSTHLRDCTECDRQFCADCAEPERHTCGAAHGEIGPEIHSKYWRYPEKFVVFFTATIVFTFAIWGPIQTFLHPPYLIDVLFGIVFFTLLLVTLWHGVATLYALYAEPKLIHEADIDWEPHWIRYVLGSFVISPLLTAVVYLYNRNRHVGLPLDELFDRF